MTLADVVKNNPIIITPANGPDGYYRPALSQEELACLCEELHLIDLSTFGGTRAEKVSVTLHIRVQLPSCNPPAPALSSQQDTLET